MRTQRTLVLTLVTFMLGLPFAASAGAADLNYSYIEGGWTEVGVKDAPDGDGWRLGGSAALGDHVHVFGSYTDAEIDNSDFDAQIMRLGLGWNTGVSDNSDLVVRANYLELDSNFPIGGSGSDGYEAEVGLRSAFGTRFETYAAAGYIDTDRGDGDLYGKLGAQYKFTPRFGLVGNVTLSDDANEYFVGPRLSF